MHHVLKSPALICNLGSTTSSFFTGSMGYSIISVYVCVRLQMQWHVVYKYKEQNRSQYGSLGYSTFDCLATWHFQPIHDTLRSVWKVWFKPAKRCASYAIYSQFLQKYFMVSNIKSLSEVEKYCSNNVPLIYTTKPIVYQFNQCSLTRIMFPKVWLSFV